jgi:hypothetical protein
LADTTPSSLCGLLGGHNAFVVVGRLLCGLLEGEGENERERKKIKKMKRKRKYNKIQLTSGSDEASCKSGLSSWFPFSLAV